MLYVTVLFSMKQLLESDLLWIMLNEMFSNVALLLKLRICHA